MPTPSEKRFEDEIVADLLTLGYKQRQSSDFDKDYCLISEDICNFALSSQPLEWEKLQKEVKTEIREIFLNRVSNEISSRGTMDVLRNGIKIRGCKFDLAFFPPNTSFNEEAQRQYKLNLFTVIRQFKFSKIKVNDSLDIGIFLNGLPIFTAELKESLTGSGWNVNDAINQYRLDRSPKEPIFTFRKCLGHFAVDPDLVYIATQLKGEDTFFLPFNQGRDRGAGNPIPKFGEYSTSYLWKEVWKPDSILNLLQYFVLDYEKEDEDGKKSGKREVIFPRFHQLECCRNIIQDAKQKGSGQNYLIQHSAGSGKSNTISWLAHQLSVLHTKEDKKVFDSIIVISDRRVLDKQLQSNLRQFARSDGVVENIEKTSRDLKSALEAGKSIIVTTIQKFPVISKQMKEEKDKRFAVIIDEAHSSQSGENRKHLQRALSAKPEEDEEDENEEIDDIDPIVAEEMRLAAKNPNISYFAFTATPKAKTLELFGVKQQNGSFTPFSLYSMKQAIEEKFILDVLANYTTYKSYWKLLKKIEEDPRYEKRKASFLLKSYVEESEKAVTDKSEIILEHFIQNVMSKLDGKAKAMIVCRSRKQAVIYKNTIDSLIEKQKLPFQALVAFSGSVKIGEKDFTEAGMNGFPDTQTAKSFKNDKYKFLIVANKFQTGFNEPLLTAMYVDKKLGGLNAVQTLSRLNRVCPPYKKETVILDFVNEEEVIQESFQAYYDTTILKKSTDPDLLYDIQGKIDKFFLFAPMDVEKFAKVFFNPKAKESQFHGIVKHVIDHFNVIKEEDQIQVREYIGDFLRLYSFLSQVITFSDIDLEKYSVFCRYILRLMTLNQPELPREVLEQVDLSSYRILKARSGSISLEPGKKELDPQEVTDHNPQQEEKEELSTIIQELNEVYGSGLPKEDVNDFIRSLERKLKEDSALQKSFEHSPKDVAKMAFENSFLDKLQELFDSHFKSYKFFNDNHSARDFLIQEMFMRMMKGMG